MKRFNVIAGTPRSGSTLLCNILAQNPAFVVSSTSALFGTITQLTHLWSQQPEIKADYSHNAVATSDRSRRVLRNIATTWYNVDTNKTVFDKNRGWASSTPLFESLFPKGKIIVCVRDPRDIMASLERQHEKEPFFHMDPASRLADRVLNQCSPKGMLGSTITNVEDLFRRDRDSAIVITYEHLVTKPEEALKSIYANLDEPWFEHNFDSVANVATDLDALYLNKYPHKGEGKIEPRIGIWRNQLSADIADYIVKRFPFYCKKLNYG